MCKKNLSELQKALLRMLRWFDGFCRENNLIYYAVGGTLLGAVRHEGFIPWDDDIDLAMPRDDYSKLEIIMGQKKFGNYVLETGHSLDPTFCYPYTKLYDVSTTLIEHTKGPLIRGIFLDIFPFDGAGNDIITAKKWFNSVYRDYQFYLTRIAAVRPERAFYKNLAVRMSQLIPEFMLDNVKLRIKLDKKCQRYKLFDSEYGGNLLGNWGQKELVPVKVIGKPKDYKFEDITIMGVENYEAYLTHIYGDWRKLPPKDKQVTHHDFLMLDLHKPYKEYEREK